MSDNKINFQIDHLDSLGQGVFKDQSEVFFIKKTLPNEKGIATHIASKKGVHFYKLKEITEASNDRMTPECPYFKECGGCDYLHTHYKNELNFKQQNLKRMLKKITINDDAFNLHGAPRRHHYRNRIQLHYNKKAQSLGFLSLERKIINIDRCLVANDLVNAELAKLRESNHWLNLVKNSSNEGHIEIYNNKISINKPYADGGFTQVFAEMNTILQNLIGEFAKNCKKSELVIDLFGGNGNLSDQLSFKKKWIIDFYKKTPLDQNEKIYLNQDLYHKDALKNLVKLKQKNRFTNCQLLIVDPPRSGLKNINEFLSELFPEKVVYVACDPQSLVRDLSSLSSSYEVKSIHLIDLFPGTHHFETVAFIERKDC